MDKNAFLGPNFRSFFSLSDIYQFPLTVLIISQKLKVPEP